MRAINQNNTRDSVQAEINQSCTAEHPLNHSLSISRNIAVSEASLAEELKVGQNLGMFSCSMRFLKLVWDNLRLVTFFRGITQAAIGLSPMLFAYSAGNVVNNLNNGLGVSWSQIGLIIFSSTALGVGLLAESLLARITRLRGEGIFDNYISSGVTKYEITSLENTEFRRRLSTVRENERQLIEFTNRIFPLMGNTVGVLGSLFAIAQQDWRIGLIVIASSFPRLKTELTHGKAVIDVEYECAEDRRRFKDLRNYSSQYYDLKEMKQLNKVEYFLERGRQIIKNVVDHVIRMESGITANRTRDEILCQAAAAGAIIWFTVQAQNGTITAGQWTFMVAALYRMTAAVGDLCKSIGNQLHYLGFAKEAVYLVEEGERESRLRDSEKLIRNIQWLKGAPEITFENVSFKYQGSQEYALKNINFTIAPGEYLGIVGDPGNGKSTLINLLSGNYKPTSGRILLDGCDLEKFHHKAWKECLGILSQEYRLFDALTIRETILLGARESENTINIEEAAKQAGITKLIESLPNGYETVIGSGYKNSRNLSTGQRQSIAVSRILFRNADVSIFDEPTSNTGPVEEKQLSDYLTQGSLSNKTRILISHRYNTLVQADRILVLKNGEIEAIGSHNQLMSAEGTYSRNFRLQAEAFNLQIKDEA